MKSTEQESADWREQLRSKGRRLTPQRELVLSAVDELGHATPEEVLAHVRTQAVSINLSTVYRNLEVLQEMGLVRHTHLNDRAATYHSTKKHAHFHVVCRGCQQVISVDPEAAEGFASALHRGYGFTIDVPHLTVFGTCAECTGADAPTHPQEDS